MYIIHVFIIITWIPFLALFVYLLFIFLLSLLVSVNNRLVLLICYMGSSYRLEKYSDKKILINNRIFYLPIFGIIHKNRTYLYIHLCA